MSSPSPADVTQTGMTARFNVQLKRWGFECDNIEFGWSTALMKIRDIAFVTVAMFVLAGCVTAPRTVDIAVRVGMSRDELRLHFGEPLRIESAASGGEDWYYRFAQWETYPTGETGTTEDFGDRTSYVAVGLGFSKNTQEHPIHVSSEGRVIEPLPKGKVVKNE